jgi:2-keto-4-pentenoate hydratase/2-oxohepta-3-ene-1,7-dioic acid hydratase in catechol pathway
MAGKVIISSAVTGVVRYMDGAIPRWAVLRGMPSRSPQDEVEIQPMSRSCITLGDVMSAIELDSTHESTRIRASELLAPVQANAALICQGLNYGSHAQEARSAERKSNLIFGKASSSITGPYSPIVRPHEVQLLDYEVEFALVMRKQMGASDRVTQENIGDYVAGVALCNDVSARDVQFGETLLQWFRGKSYRTFCPVGPVLWLFERGEVASALDHIGISLSVNGELRQQADSRQLIWKPVETLNYVATILDMRQGDLLLTGTPGGVTSPVTPRMVEIIKSHLLADDLRRDELRIEMTKGRPFLKQGDVVTAEMVDVRGGGFLGGLHNTVLDSR